MVWFPRPFPPLHSRAPKKKEKRGKDPEPRQNSEWAEKRNLFP
jgi:hypothetical protein